jgi:hypothetical protein
VAEAPADIVRRAVEGVLADFGDPFATTLAELLGHIATDMAGAEAFECKAMGAVSSESDGYRADWTAALKLARFYGGAPVEGASPPGSTP